MRDLFIVLATALLLRACEADGDRAATPRSAGPNPSLTTLTIPSSSGEWRRQDIDGRPVLLFGERGGRPVAGISCDREAGRLLVERMMLSPSGGVETMTVAADNRSRTLPVLWDGASLPIAVASLKLDDRLVDSLARSGGEIELELGDERKLVLPADRNIEELIRECRG